MLLRDERQHAAGAGMALILFLLAAAAPAAVIEAGFDDGATDQAVDGYPGMAGDGWTSGWFWHSGTHTGAASVEDAAPLAPGSANYLSVVAPGGQRDVTISRSYDDFGGVDLSAPHTISFDFRADDVTAWTAAGATWFRMSSAMDSSIYPALWRWYVGVRGGQNEGRWFVADGSPDPDGSSWTGVDTGIALDTDDLTTVYTFQFDMDPASSSFDLTLTDSHGNTYFGEDLLFRRATDGNGDPVVTGGTHLNFNMQKTNDTEVIDMTQGFSIDNIRVIPEPHSVLLVTVGLASLLSIRRSRAS